MEGVLYHEECLVRLDRKGHLVTTSDGIRTKLIPSFSNFSLIKAGCKILKLCQQTTKLFEQEKIPTIPLLVERLFTVDKELEEIIETDDEESVGEFAAALKAELGKRFPNYGADNILNAMANYLNPSLKGCHLDYLNKLDSVKEKMQEKLAICPISSGSAAMVEDPRGISTSSCFLGESNLSHPCGKQQERTGFQCCWQRGDTEKSQPCT